LALGPVLDEPTEGGLDLCELYRVKQSRKEFVQTSWRLSCPANRAEGRAVLLKWWREGALETWGI
jgi:hypothetical protein